VQHSAVLYCIGLFIFKCQDSFCHERFALKVVFCCLHALHEFQAAMKSDPACKSTNAFMLTRAGTKTIWRKQNDTT
jgi:hypothetical protein